MLCIRRAVLGIAVLTISTLALSANASNRWTFDDSESPLPDGTCAYFGSVATGPDGEIYYTYHVDDFGSTDIYFIRSLDFGVTWSTPVKIDTDPVGMNGSTVQSLLAGPEGEVYVIFEDNRD